MGFYPVGVFFTQARGDVANLVGEFVEPSLHNETSTSYITGNQENTNLV